MGIHFEWNRTIDDVTGDFVNDGSLLFLANECKRLMDPYVPAENLVLAQNVSVHVENGQGIVEYLSPYAHYQWEGEVYGPNYPIRDGAEIIGWRSPPHKTPTGRQLKHSKFRHPQATSHWEKAMLTARRADLVGAMQRYLSRGGGR